MSVSKKRKPVIDLFIKKDKVALFWFFFALVVAGGFWWERQKLIASFQQKPQFFVMDANSTYYRSWLCRAPGAGRNGQVPP